jgi:hypothetical protein
MRSRSGSRRERAGLQILGRIDEQIRAVSVAVDRLRCAAVTGDSAAEARTQASNVSESKSSEFPKTTPSRASPLGKVRSATLPFSLPTVA